jgi:hypothetical protein
MGVLRFGGRAGGERNAKPVGGGGLLLSPCQNARRKRRGVPPRRRRVAALLPPAPPSTSGEARPPPWGEDRHGGSVRGSSCVPVMLMVVGSGWRLPLPLRGQGEGGARRATGWAAPASTRAALRRVAKALRPVSGRGRESVRSHGALGGVSPGRGRWGVGGSCLCPCRGRVERGRGIHGLRCAREYTGCAAPRGYSPSPSSWARSGQQWGRIVL